MQTPSPKRFVGSFSTGKDSTLAIYLAIKEGMQPVELITTYNTDRAPSWFHGVPEDLIAVVSDCMNLPIRLVLTSGDDYEKNFEKALMEAKAKGAEVCVFGDIDLDHHRAWCTARCEAAGLEAYFPLWQKNRKEVVEAFIDAGFQTRITIVNTKMLDARFVGKVLTHDVALDIEAEGADICGENGEYHTFVFDGPLFNRPVPHTLGNIRPLDHYIIQPVLV